MKPGRLLNRLLDALCACLAPIARLLDARFFYLDGARIGDVGASLAWLVQSQRLGWTPRFKGVLVPIPTPRLANPCYGDYWRRYVRIVTDAASYPIAFRLATRPGLAWAVEPATLADGRALDRDSALAASHHEWEAAGRPPLFALTAEHRRRGRAALVELGLEHDSWFVALHVREAGYLGEQPDSYRSHRNADVATYLPAVRRITDRGGWVIRVGDPSMKPLPRMERVVDYVHSSVQSDWMDIYLAAACRFFLGSSSGLFVVAWTFGRPCALANWDSLVTRPWSSKDRFIPKLWWLKSEGRYLTFQEQVQPPYVAPLYLARTRPEEFERLGLSPVDNSPDEITALVEEMFQPERTTDAPLADELRATFERIVETYYPYGATARIGADFVVRHRNLLSST